MCEQDLADRVTVFSLSSITVISDFLGILQSAHFLVKLNACTESGMAKVSVLSNPSRSLPFKIFLEVLRVLVLRVPERRLCL